MSYRDSYESEDYPRMTPVVQWLIAVTVAVSFVQFVVLFKAGTIPEWLGFAPSKMPQAWWTVVTYMFVHGGPWHLALNMYTLWIFGPRLEYNWRPGTFLGYYIWCGVGGVVFHALLVRGSSGLIGASAAVFGVMLAYGVRWPDDELMLFGVIPIKVKWLVAVMFISNLVSGVLTMGRSGAGGGTAYLAHIGGFVFGWLYLRTPSMQGIERLRQRISPAPDAPDDDTPRPIPRSLPRSRSRERESEADEIVAQSKAMSGKRPAITAPRAGANRERQLETLNKLLDKISQKGLESLSPEERQMLEEVSKALADG